MIVLFIDGQGNTFNTSPHDKNVHALHFIETRTLALLVGEFVVLCVFIFFLFYQMLVHLIDFHKRLSSKLIFLENITNMSFIETPVGVDF